MNPQMSALVIKMSHFLATQMEVCKNRHGIHAYRNEKGQKDILGCILPTYVLDHMGHSSQAADLLYGNDMVFTSAIHNRLKDCTYEERLNFIRQCEEYHDEDYGYAHDIRQLKESNANYHERVATIRRRIKKFIGCETGVGSL